MTFQRHFSREPFNGELPQSKDEAIDLLSRVQKILAEIRIYRKTTAGEWPYPGEQSVAEWDKNRLQVLVTFLSYPFQYYTIIQYIILPKKNPPCQAEKLHLLSTPLILSKPLAIPLE